eukprot:scaffold7092_cov262-Pinguiococcus_pyrenoidosus.AAC.30
MARKAPEALPPLSKGRPVAETGGNPQFEERFAGSNRAKPDLSRCFHQSADGGAESVVHGVVHLKYSGGEELLGSEGRIGSGASNLDNRYFKLPMSGGDVDATFCCVRGV